MKSLTPDTPAICLSCGGSLQEGICQKQSAYSYVNCRQAVGSFATY